VNLVWLKYFFAFENNLFWWNIQSKCTHIGHYGRNVATGKVKLYKYIPV